MDPCQKRIPKWAEMAPQKARNDPNMLKIPKIFDFSHEMIRFKFLYRGSTKDLIRVVLNITGELFDLNLDKNQNQTQAWSKIVIYPSDCTSMQV